MSSVKNVLSFLFLIITKILVKTKQGEQRQELFTFFQREDYGEITT